MPVRKRKEVQEMLRSMRHVVTILASLLIAAGARGAIFPDQVGAFKKGELKTIGVPDQALYSEYGLDAAEQAAYASDDGHFTASAWRFRDSTGALAMFEARRPPGATRGDTTKLAVRTSDGVIFAYGNYVFQLTGTLPAAADLQQLYANLPKLEQSPLPPLVTDLPVDGLVPNSERYVVGPVSLDRFFGGIAPSMAAFHLGAEAQVGKYKTAKGLLTLAIFNYPTPNMARDRYQEFQKIPGAVARRVGSLVAITIEPPDADAAERVLSKVKYETNITWNERVPVNQIKGTGKLLVEIFIFSGLLVALCLVAGLLYGGARVFARKMNRGEDPDAMITLHLGGK
jgi:hypothetical protein